MEVMRDVQLAELAKAVNGHLVVSSIFPSVINGSNHTCFSRGS